MKKGIHPDYKLTKITCVCGNVIKLAQQYQIFMLKFALPAIHSILESRNLLIQLDALTALTSAMV